MSTKKPPKLEHVHIRLYADDIVKVKLIAAKKLLPWQTELRLLVRRALDVPIVNGNRGES